MKATISADIIKSTSLDKNTLLELQNHLRVFIEMIPSQFPGCWGRLTRGDNLECVVPSAKLSMLLAVMLKCHVKAFGVKFLQGKGRSAGQLQFLRHGVRIAIGLGSLRTSDPNHDIIDGKAIYASGRALDGMSSRMRSNLIIEGEHVTKLKPVQAILGLTDALLTHATPRQCEILLLRFRGMSEQEIARVRSISQVAVNAHLRRAGWYALSQAVQAFEEIVG